MVPIVEVNFCFGLPYPIINSNVVEVYLYRVLVSDSVHFSVHAYFYC